VRLDVTLSAAPVRSRRVHVSRLIRVPTNRPWLQYAIGVRESAASQGAVEFRLDVCRAGECECLHQETLDPADPAQLGWRDRMLPLDDWAGDPIRLRFETRALAAPEGGYLIAHWEQPRMLHEATERGPGRHDLLLISIDTLRADHLSAYGYGRETSPYMAGVLSPRSTIFEHAVAPATATAASHMSLFTSLLPSVHGVTSNVARRALPAAVATMAEVLRDRGYVTSSVNENGALTSELGFGRGFDYHRQYRGTNILRPDGFVSDVFDSGRRFVEAHRSQRWFLFLHTYQVHAPYRPPRETLSLFQDGDDPKHPDNQRVGVDALASYPVRYDREIRHVDTQLGQFMSELEAAGHLENALVVITSDHGEAFGEHGTVGHGKDVFQEVTHIPLILMGPDIPEGMRVAQPVGLIDVLPTMLELLDITAPKELTGRSFAPLLSPSDDQDRWDDVAIVSESWQRSARPAAGGMLVELPVLAVRRGHLKLIRTKVDDGFRYELYDLNADPHEQQDLWAAGRGRSDELAIMASELKAIADDHQAKSATQAKQLGLPWHKASEVDPSQLSPDRAEALRALGYIE
jgi:arylsulfatase A-like enzyme